MLLLGGIGTKLSARRGSFFGVGRMAGISLRILQEGLEYRGDFLSLEKERDAGPLRGTQNPFYSPH